jgi:hypothetical protein
MISVLICSAKPDLLKIVTENIQKTIGIPFEILYFDNRIAKKGICSVYNELASKSQFNYLCFIHEDVLLRTENWGKIITDIFLNNPQTGLIGIAGSKYKSAYFSGWYTGVKELDCANYIHEYSSKTEYIFLSPSGNKVEEVVCIDGVFMCSTKTAWSKIIFDEKLLKGFHFYDIDFSVRMAHKYKVLVTFDIELVHITTGGDYSNNWVQTAISYHQKKKEILPFSKASLNAKRIDKKIIITTMDHLKNYKIDFSIKIKWIVFQKLYLNPLFYYTILKFILYQPLGLKRIHSNLKNK